MKKNTRVINKQSSIPELIRNAGGKLTPQRVEIIKVLQNFGKPVTAKEIYNKVIITQPSVSLDTVYRNLELLTASGVVSHMNLQQTGKSYYEFMGDHHHHHAICTDCGDIACVDICIPVDKLKVAGNPDFVVTSHAFEIYGHCGKCNE
ncbi:MAG: transcriptional repressor [Leptospiraceae bacterium]|nr:transcriptional repressor [Leptospiraceae bacterium]